VAYELMIGIKISGLIDADADALYFFGSWSCYDWHCL